jgi:DNA-binding transcriptional ArsR family regulator
MSKDKSNQLGFPEWSPSIRWFHIFRSMIDNGDVVKLGSGAVLTYLVIKSYVDFDKGISFPSLDLIAVKSGQSKRSVSNHIKKLEELGYVRKIRQSKKGNVYRLREKLPIEVYNKEKKEKEPVMASFDYVPMGVSQAMTDIRKLIVEGDIPSGSKVHIENLSVNIQVNPKATTAIQQLNLDQIKDRGIRETLERIIKLNSE